MAGERVGADEFSSADFYDAANAIPQAHAPWRRVVAAGIAVLFAASIVLIGLICTTGKAAADDASARAHAFLNKNPKGAD